jgi:predicted nucleic acid-binding protein
MRHATRCSLRPPALRYCRQNNPIFIPTIVVVELRYLVEKRTLTEQECQDLITTLKDPTTAPTVAPLDLLAAETLEQIPRSIVPDMPDRIIAATALALGFPLVTRDHKIQMLTNVQTI